MSFKCSCNPLPSMRLGKIQPKSVIQFEFNFVAWKNPSHLHCYLFLNNKTLHNAREVDFKGKDYQSELI